MNRGSGSMKLKQRVPLRALLRVASVAGGVQFGWALQLSLLTPYVQELGIPHQYASLIWLCGPISGMIVQPLVGHYSDQCTSSFGRRRPFIVVGALPVIISILVIGFAADIGHALGDSLYQNFKTRGVIAFVIGFWLLDLANNTLQGPCRALLADYTAEECLLNCTLSLARFSPDYVLLPPLPLLPMRPSWLPSPLFCTAIRLLSSLIGTTVQCHR